MAEERSLPGWPKKKLVKDVRRHLWHYGIRPVRSDIWRATWAWAEAIARSYWRTHWPLPSEIGTQYILLLLVEMKQSCMLRLPYRAGEKIPPEVAAMLTDSPTDRSVATRERVRSEPRLDKKNSRGNDGSSLGKMFVVAAVLLLLVAAVVLSRKGAEPTVAKTPVPNPQVRSVEPVATPKSVVAAPTAATTGNETSKPSLPAGEWISKDASYAVSSQYAGYFPLVTLLTDQGERHHGSMAFFTDPKRVEPPYIVVTLTSPCALQGFCIQNITSNGKPEHAAGLTVWVSSDQKDWEKVWTAEKVQQEWRYTLPQPVSARYVKIGLPTAGTLHLRTVKLFGQRRPGEVIDTHPATATVVPLHSDPDSEWISRDASYVTSSQYLGYAPGRALLTGTGLRHEDDSIAFYTDPKQVVPPYIVITLTSPCTLREFHIQNVTSGKLEHAADLTVWVSLDQKDWQKVWTAETVEKEWRYTLPEPVSARYVKIGLPTVGALHLRTVELFGQRNSAPTGTSKPTATVVAQPTKAPPVVSEAESRRSIPDDDAQVNGMKLIKEVYGDEYESARTADQKKVLARKLLMKAKESGADQTSQYLLLKLAKDVAVQAADGQTAFEAVDRMSEVFQCDGVEMKCEALSAVAKRARLVADHRTIARQADEVIDAAVKNDRFDLVTELSELAISEANAARDTELVKQMRSRMSSLRELKSAYNEAQQAVERLEQSQNDPEANLATGRYYCFYKDDWAKGLPMLARGRDSTVKELATKDLENPQMPEDQVKIGDAWWELAAQKEGTERQSIESRAAYWYNRALPQVTGLTKDKVEKRLKALTSDVASHAPGGESPSKLAATIVGHYLVGVSQRASKEQKIVYWEVRQDRSVWDKDRQIAEWTATDAQVRVVFSDKALGEATLRPKKRDLFVGVQIRANGETWICELQKVFVVAVWEHHWGSNSGVLKCWSTGRLGWPDGSETWERKGSTIIFHFRNGGIDTCTLAPDGKSFKGSNQHGLPIWGKLISEQ